MSPMLPDGQSLPVQGDLDAGATVPLVFYHDMVTVGAKTTHSQWSGMVGPAGLPPVPSEYSETRFD